MNNTSLKTPLIQIIQVNLKTYIFAAILQIRFIYIYIYAYIEREFRDLISDSIFEYLIFRQSLCSKWYPKIMHCHRGDSKYHYEYCITKIS